MITKDLVLAAVPDPPGAGKSGAAAAVTPMLPAARDVRV